MPGTGVTGSWKNVSASTALDLSSGTGYVIQNRGASAVFVEDSASEPSDTNSAFMIPPSGGYFTTTPDDNIWVRTVPPDGQSWLVSSET